MKRTPLTRRTPLARSTPLRAHRAGIYSARRLAELNVEAERRRAAVRVAFERDRHRCQAAHLVPTVPCAGGLDGHEPLTRGRGGDPFDPDQIITVCRIHHDWIGNHPDAAHELGLLVHSWERNR